jgi:hypothetical protein
VQHQRGNQQHYRRDGGDRQPRRDGGQGPLSLNNFPSLH